MRDGVPSILNPDDANALEAALQIKDEYRYGSRCGDHGAGRLYALRECLAMGAERLFSAAALRRCGYLLHQHDTGLTA